MSMKTKVIFSTNDTCVGNSCPTIYETDRGTYLVQGSIINRNEGLEITLPDNESVVEIPKDFLDRFKRS